MSGSLWLCLESASLPVLPLPSNSGLKPLPPARAPLKGIHPLPHVAVVTAPAHPALPAAPSTSLHPRSASARQGGLLEQGWSCCTDDPRTEQCLESAAAQVLITAKPCILWSTGRKDVSSKMPADGDMRRALCSQPLAQEHHGGSRKAQGAGGEVDLGWWVQPLVFLGAKSTEPTCWDSPAVLHF